MPELREWVDRLVDDPVIAFPRPALADRLRQMQVQLAREDADALERTAGKTEAVAARTNCRAMCFADASSGSRRHNERHQRRTRAVAS